MGCDIHLWVEVRDNESSPWHLAEVPGWTCSWCDGKGSPCDGRECYFCNGTGIVNIFMDRNYDLFGMLANVRNGRGFAGIRTGDAFDPISDPRGWPEDLSAELRHHFRMSKVAGFGDDITEEERDAYETNNSKHRWPGEHSETWLRLDEVLSYFNDSRESRHEGWVSPAEYKIFKEKGHPESWSGGVSGGGVRHISNEEMDAVISDPEKYGENTDAFLSKYYTLVCWTSEYRRDAGKNFVELFLPACQTLGEPQNVRLVFNFDS